MNFSIININRISIHVFAVGCMQICGGQSAPTYAIGGPLS